MRRKIPKNKGVRYVANTLSKYQKHKYGNYKQALPSAYEILEKLKANGEDVSVKNIWKYSRNRRVKKQVVPELTDFLKTPAYYWELVNYDAEIKRCTNEIWFYSEVSPQGMPLIQGGSTINPDEYFKDYISYCNKLAAQVDRNNTRYTSDDCLWFVMCTEPIKTDGKYISTIISVNRDGVRTDYGFDSYNPKSSPPEPIPLEEKPSRQSKSKKTSQPAAEASAMGEAERIKQLRGMIQDFREDLKAKLITKKEYLREVDRILKKLETGGNV